MSSKRIRKEVETLKGLVL